MVASLRKRFETIQKKLAHRNTVHIIDDEKGTKIYGRDKTKIYVPVPTAIDFHHDDRFFRCAMGPFGSGKSTFSIQEIVRRARQMPVWRNGRRRSRWAIVRNTSGELVTTTLQTWLQWFDDLGDIYHRQKPILTYEHAFNDESGTVELEILFLALDRPDHVRKIKSLELTGCYINELSEVPKAILEHMTGRVGRYPSKAECPTPYWSGIIADTNPPDEDHWIYTDIEEKTIPGYQLYKQPPGLIQDEDGTWHTNPDADNVHNLPTKDYYERLAAGKSNDFIKVFCLGQYGTVGTGKIVFSEFNPDLHAVDHLEAVQGLSLYIGWDFGLTPACVVCQFTARGQLLVLKEYTADGMGIRTFAESIVIPGIKRDFPYCKVGKSFADPAGSKRSEIMEEMSCIGELKQLGIETAPAATNDIPPRLASIRYFLNLMIEGKPAFCLDRKKCPLLFKGFVKSYVYRRLAVPGEERYKNEPDKNLFSHPMDALQYVCLEIASTSIMEEKNTVKQEDFIVPAFRWQS